MKYRLKIITMIMAISITCSGCGLSSANRAYSKALDAYEDKNYQAAKEYFIKAIAANEEKAEYHIDYGFTLLSLDEYREARVQFETVILDKEIPMVRENNKKAYRGIGISYLMENQFESAILNFDKALEIKEAKELDVDILFYKANALEQSGDLTKAAQMYTQLLEQKSEDATVYSARANIYRLIGNYDLSIADYDKAVELSKQSFNLYFGKFASLKELHKEEEALAVLDQAAKLDINGDDDKYELAKVHFYQGNYESASNGFSILMEKGYTQGYYFLGEMKLINKDYEGALVQYKSYLDAGNKAFGLLYNQMLTCYLQTSNLTEAKNCLDRAKEYLDVSIQDQILKNEVIYLEKTGDYEAAYALLSTYLVKYPEDEEAKRDYYFLKTRVEGASQSQEEVDTTMEGETPVAKP